MKAPELVPLEGLERVCEWCRGPLPRESATGRRRRQDSKTCSKRCRQASNRFRVAPATRRVSIERGAAADVARPRRLAYADPPYPGRAHLYDGHPDGGRGEVDHAELVARLVDEYPDGWALSTAADALQAVLALCPPDVRVCSWTRRVFWTRSKRPLSAWEPVIVRGGRPLPTREVQRVLDAVGDDVHVDDPRELADALVYRGRHDAFPGALVGMKPAAFSEWLFAQLGALPGDRLDDLFPGSGAVGEAWQRWIRRADQVAGGRDASYRARGDASRPAAEDLRDASHLADEVDARHLHPDQLAIEEAA